MAKTKERIMANQIAEMEAEQLVEETYYKENLMNVLSLACNYNYVYVLTVRHGMLIIEDTQYNREHTFTLNYTKNSYNNLCDLESDLSVLEDQIKKQKELTELRKNALNKLSDEEQAALGL